MKAQLLKIAGVKSDKEFYKKFPDEESFMKAHGKEFKKAMRGSKIQKAQGGIKTPPNQSDYNDYNEYAAAMDAYNQSLYTSPVPALQNVGAPANIGDEGPQLIPSQENLNQQTLNWGTPNQITGVDKLPKSKFDPMSMLPLVGGVLGAIPKIKEQQLAIKKAKQSSKLTGVQADVIDSARNQPIKRQYIRPEDVIVQPEQMFPSYGVGTNVLARDGAEIANTFAPGNIYDDGGYEPLNDSERLKQYQTGGGLDKFSSAFNKTGINPASLSGFLGGTGYESGGFGDIGTGVANILPKVLTGKAASLAGPIGMAAGFIGGAVDSAMKQKEQAYLKQAGKNINRMVGSQLGGDLRSAYPGVFKDGGWVSHDWQPQMITQFGEHKLSDLLHPPHDADMLRAGGHIKSYTPPSEGAMETFAMGGDLKTMWGGYAEPMSYNPYLPDGGETVMFKGQSHDETDGKGNTGIGVMYGQNPVEVERGEPAVKLKDGSSGDDSLVVYGNLKIPNQFLHEIGDPKAKGKKFKHYAKDLSKQEAKQNKIIEKSSEQLDGINVITPFDKLKLASLNANIMGGNMKLKDIAEKKMNAAAVQNAINDTSEELALDADYLAKGVVKIDKKALKEQKAKYGIDIPKAQPGISLGGAAGLYNAPSTDYKTLDERFEKTKTDALSLLKRLYPDKKVEIKEASGDRDISTQRGLHASGASKTDVSIHNLGGAKDLVIYVDGKLVSDPTVYANTVHTAARKHGLYNLDWKADPFHVSAIPEGKGSAYTSLIQKYPELKNKETYKKTIAHLSDLAKKNQLTKSELNAYKQLIGGDASGLTPYNFDYQAVAGNYPKMEWEDVNVPTTTSTTEKKDEPSVVTPPVEKKKQEVPVTPYKRNLMMDAFNQVLPYIRPSDAEQLDPMQLTGEMYAMSQNQVEPVWAQKIQPDLSTPYDISLQDIINQNQADYNATQRMVGYNPAALASLNAQKYEANQKVLGEQFRLNQGEKQRVYEQNRNLLNQFKLQNLGILDQQYQRQAEALSKTKAITQAALNSVSSKIAQNKLENRTLQTYENTYNYRYSPNFRAQNMNPLWQPNVPTVYNGPDGTKYTEMPVKDNSGNVIYYKQVPVTNGQPSLSTPGITNANAPLGPEPYNPEEPVSGKKGLKIKKNNLNSSIVKALKNI
tara:strand:+ start:1413 stop:4889 length:3477 start_codon:yes stop_codon:yes gene_type:complete